MFELVSSKKTSKYSEIRSVTLRINRSSNRNPTAVMLFSIAATQYLFENEFPIKKKFHIYFDSETRQIGLKLTDQKQQKRLGSINIHHFSLNYGHLRVGCTALAAMLSDMNFECALNTLGFDILLTPLDNMPVKKNKKA